MGRLSVKVAVIDDQEIIRLGVQQSLSEIPHCTFVGGFSTLDMFCDSAAYQKVDVILLDDSLPDIRVQESIRTVQKHCPDAAVLLLGSKLTARGIHEAIQAGAAGVVCKYEPLQDILVMGIRHAHAGKVYLSPGAGLIALSLGSVPTITKCLHDVLVLMAKGAEIPDMIQALGISRKAIYLRQQRLCEILDVKTKEQIIAEAIRRGLLSGEE
jgi:DNA-binding NarL/FixJ family response regulator